MFDLFFLQCKTEIYKNRIRDLPWYAIVLLVLLLAAGLGTVIFSFFLRNPVGFAICYGLVVADAFLVAFVDHRRKKQANAIAADYHTQTIGQLEALLKGQPYRLYHTAGLDWLIACCDQHIHTPQKPSPASVLPFIFSIFTLAYGLVLEEMSINDVVITTMSLLALLLIWEIANRTVVTAWVDWYRNPNKLVYQRLKSDLEYIKTQRSASNNPQHRPPNKGQNRPQSKGQNSGPKKGQSKGQPKSQPHK